MSASKEVDPQDLTLGDLGEELKLEHGPRIDTSEEFPLPTLGIEEEIDAEILFPLEGEPTEEDLPPTDRHEPPTPTSVEEEWIDAPEGPHGSGFLQEEEAEPPSFGMDDVEPPSLGADEAYFDEVTVADPGDPPVELEEDAFAEPLPDDSGPPSGKVRKVSLKRKGEQPGKKVRLWIPAAGLAIIVAAQFASRPFLADLEGSSVPAPVLIVASQPAGELFSEDTLLGTTPLALTAAQISGRLEVRKPGYRSAAVPSGDTAGRSDDLPVRKQLVELEPAPVPLAWTGLPEGSTVWLDGKGVEPSTLAELPPGRYSLKVKPPDRPAVTVPLVAEIGGEAVRVGEQVSQELARQPTISLALAVPEGEAADDLSLSVKSLDAEQPFNQKISLGGDGKASLVVPSAGKYRIDFSGNTKFKAASSTVELAPGASRDLTVALEKVPPTPVAAAPSSAPEPYYPPPVYRPYYPPYSGGGGGGGGGGRIAPPSF